MSTSSKKEDPVETYEEEEEVEITDNEEGQDDDDQGEESAEESAEETEPPVLTPPAASSAGKATPNKNGKVKPSKEVKEMKLDTPEGVAKRKGSKLPMNKNPFPSFGEWTETELSEIEIVVPVLTGKNETTNDLTRDTKPEMRYWKAPIVFKFNGYTSTTMRFDNVPIPFHTGKGYGSSYVYLCLPGFAADKFAEAGKIRRPTVAHEKSLKPDPNRWWKVANKVEESFGIINNDNKKFQKKSLETIFDATSSGILASVVLSFMFKAHTDSKQPLKPTTGGTISVTLERAYITKTDVNVQMPVKVVDGNKKKVDPVAVSRDVADDSLMKRLQELGL